MQIRSVALVLGLVLMPALSGATASDDALAVVKETLTAARKIVDAGGTRDDKLASLRSLARNMLDLPAMGRRAMGDVLAKQPPPQQQEYLELFGDVMVRAYLSKLLLFRKPRFGYRKPKVNGDVVRVDTVIITSKDEYHVDYEMRESDGRWLATDVIVEDISLIDNYREQFASLLRGRSFAELLDLMRRKTRQSDEERE